jgi:hypothetical protein
VGLPRLVSARYQILADKSFRFQQSSLSIGAVALGLGKNQ